MFSCLRIPLTLISLLLFSFSFPTSAKVCESTDLEKESARIQSNAQTSDLDKQALIKTYNSLKVSQIKECAELGEEINKNDAEISIDHIKRNSARRVKELQERRERVLARIKNINTPEDEKVLSFLGLKLIHDLIVKEAEYSSTVIHDIERATKN